MITAEDTKAGLHSPILYMTSVDNRKAKVYGIHIEVSVRFPSAWKLTDYDRVPYNSETRTGLDIEGYVTLALSGKVPPLCRDSLSRPVIDSPEVGAIFLRKRVSYRDPVRVVDCYGEPELQSLLLELWLPAIKPSLIPDQEDVERVVRAELPELLVEPFRKARQARAVLLERLAVHSVANRTAAALGRMADKRARKVSRFRQRLAALVAELEEEQRLQLEEIKQEARTGEIEGTPEDSESLELGLRWASEAIPAANPGRFPCTTDQFVVPIESVTAELDGHRYRPLEKEGK